MFTGDQRKPHVEPRNTQRIYSALEEILVDRTISKKHTALCSINVKERIFEGEYKVSEDR